MLSDDMRAKLQSHIDAANAQLDPLSNKIDEGAGVLDSVSLREMARLRQLGQDTKDTFPDLVPDAVALGVLSVVVNQTEFLRLGMEIMGLKIILLADDANRINADLDNRIKSLEAVVFNA